MTNISLPTTEQVKVVSSFFAWRLGLIMIGTVIALVGGFWFLLQSVTDTINKRIDDVMVLQRETAAKVDRINDTVVKLDTMLSGVNWRKFSENTLRQQQEGIGRFTDNRLPNRKASVATEQQEKIIKKLRDDLKNVDSNNYNKNSKNIENTAMGKFLIPVMGSIAASYSGYSKSALGLVFEAPPISIVYSPWDGVISYAGIVRSFGNVVVIDVGDGYQIVIAGLSVIDREKGEYVSRGEPIARSGIANDNTEEKNSALYLQMRLKGDPIDPTPWFEISVQ